MANEKEIIRDTSVFATTKYLSYFFTILSGLVIARVLGPADFGVFSALMLIVNYSQYSDLGLFSAMLKKVPFYSGKKEYNKAQKTEDIAFSGAMIIIIFISLILIIASFFIKNLSPNTINSLRIIAVIITLQQIFFFYQNHLRIEKKFLLIGKTLLIYSITYFISIIILIMGFRLEGVFFASLIAYSIALIYIFKKENFKFRINIMPKKTVQLMGFGFPLLTIGIMYIILTSIDKLMIIKFMDKIQLGYYSIAIMIAGIIFFIPQAITYIMFSHFLERYGEREDKLHIKNHLFQPTLIISYLLPIVIGLVFITAPVAVYYILPKYIQGITSVKILVCATFFMSVIVSAGNFLVTLNKEKKMVSTQIIFITLAIILNYIFITRGYGINGIAIATAMSYFFYSTCILVYSFGHYITKTTHLIQFFIKTYIPYLYIILILALSNIIPITGDLPRDILLTTLKLIIFIVFSLPLVWLANKKTGVVKTFFDMVILRFKKKNSNL